MRFRLQWPMAGTRWISAACLSAFLVQCLADRVVLFDGRTFGDFLTLTFGVHAPLLFAGFVWQPLTYIFLHGSVAHLCLNVVSLVLFGRILEPVFGTRRFVALFIASGIVGGLGWLAADLWMPSLLRWMLSQPNQTAVTVASWMAERFGVFGGHGVCIGASAGVCGLAGAMAAIAPRRREIWLLVILTLAEPLLRGAGVAHAAHIFGCIVGIILGMKWRAAVWRG